MCGWSTVILYAVIVSCGGNAEQESATESAVDLMPEKIAETQLSRSSEPRLFVGDSLWEYINGGAEVYHTYDFVDVATAEDTIQFCGCVVKCPTADLFIFDIEY